VENVIDFPFKNAMLLAIENNYILYTLSILILIFDLGHDAGQLGRLQMFSDKFGKLEQ